MVEPSPLQERVGQHYSQGTSGDLLAAMLAALAAEGKDVNGPLRYEDMGSLDHFHGGALSATRTLAQLGQLAAGDRVLDMVAVFGGPARMLAAEAGCHVTVLDPNRAFITAGRALTARPGLQDNVDSTWAVAWPMWFADEQFDVVSVPRTPV